MATRFDSQALILEKPVRIHSRHGLAMFSFLPIGPLLGTRYDVLEKIRAIKTPLLGLHGDRDEVVPFDQDKLVFAAAPQPKKFIMLAGAGHNDTYLVGSDRYFEQLRQLIEETAPPRR